MQVNNNIPLFIIKGLLENSGYCRNVIMNLKGEYFSAVHSPVVKFIKAYFMKYDKVPNPSVIQVKLANHINIDDETKKLIRQLFVDIDNTAFNPIEEGDWLYDETKVYITREALKYTMVESPNLIKKATTLEEIQSVALNMAGSVSLTWDDDLGMEYLEEIEERYDRLSDEDVLVATGITKLDNAIGGGIRPRSLFLAGGQSGVGKTLILGNFAMHAMSKGKNVVYISLEIDKDTMAKRIDSVFIEESILSLVPKRKEMIEKIKKKHSDNNCGRLFIKEFPASDTCAKDLGIYLEKLKTLKQFVPELIVVDYVGLMRPNDKMMARSTYERGKYVSEELRGLAFEYNCPLVSAVQTGRQSYGQKNVGMEDTSDSIAIVQTADTYITLGKPKDFDDNHQLFGRVVKSRGVKEGTEFILQIDYDKLQILEWDEAEELKTEQEQSSDAKIAQELKGLKSKGITGTKKKEGSNYEGIE
jgi:hypothetical protein